jgi:hypothetical protein
MPDLPRALATLLTLALGPAAAAQVLLVPGDFPTVQAALEAALPGERIEVAPGVYGEDLDFLGKDVHLVGAGLETVIQGSGTRPVVRFVSGETNAAILDSVVVTGGESDRGGGLRIVDASPTIVRSFIVENRSSRMGSGVHVEGASSAPLLYNNLIAYNTHAAGDPHGVEIQEAAPILVNNTIVRGDSNGVILRGASPAILRGNVIARNGSRVDGRRRGRGICDFSTEPPTLHANVFHRNRIAALLRGGKDWKKIRRFERRNPDAALVIANADGKPGFLRGPKRSPDRQDLADLTLRERGRAKARDAGDSRAACNDLDGTRNDAGHGGGPFAAPSTDLPGDAACGIRP